MLINEDLLKSFSDDLIGKLDHIRSHYLSENCHQETNQGIWESDPIFEQFSDAERHFKHFCTSNTQLRQEYFELNPVLVFRSFREVWNESKSKDKLPKLEAENARLLNENARLQEVNKATEEELVKEREKTGKSAKRKNYADWTKYVVTTIIAVLVGWVAYLNYQLNQKNTLQSVQLPATQLQQTVRTSPMIDDSTSSPSAFLFQPMFGDSHP